MRGTPTSTRRPSSASMPQGRAPVVTSASHTAAACAAGTCSTKPSPCTSLARWTRTPVPAIASSLWANGASADAPASTRAASGPSTPISASGSAGAASSTSSAMRSASSAATRPSRTRTSQSSSISSASAASRRSAVTRPWTVSSSAGQPSPAARRDTSLLSMPWRNETRSGPVARTTVRKPASTSAAPRTSAPYSASGSLKWRGSAIPRSSAYDAPRATRCPWSAVSIIALSPCPAVPSLTRAARARESRAMAGSPTSYEDILYEARDGIAWITINRPQVLNAFRAKTVDELVAAFRAAWHDPDVGVAVLTGAGDRAFSSGGDQSERSQDGYGGGGGGPGLDVHGLHGIMRAIPKPVIAMVNGYAIGGGHVLHVLCDLTIAADTARFGQVGPRVGSVDPGFGTAYLARVVGEKKAREIWYLCRQYTAEQALGMGLVNAVVPAAALRPETDRWCRELLEKSPTALKLAKQSFNADTEHISGITELGFAALELYYRTDEAEEGRRAFLERRPPRFRPPR